MDAPKCKLCESRHWGLCGPDRKRANAQLADARDAAIARKRLAAIRSNPDKLVTIGDLRPKQRKPPKAKARNARRLAPAA